MGIDARKKKVHRQRNIRCKSICYLDEIAALRQTSAATNPPILHMEELRPPGERREPLRIGACHPGLAAQCDDLIEQGGAAQGVDVGVLHIYVREV
jgi:hypothetical protein